MDVIEKTRHSGAPQVPSGPRFGQVQVEVSSRCNLRCSSCLYPRYESRWIARDLSSEVFERLLAAAPRCNSMHLQGWGESLLRRDIPWMVAQVVRSGAKATLSSNGTVMTAELARGLIDAGLHSMSFSLSGPDRLSQDKVRGTGTFEAAVRSIQTFVSQRNGNDPPVWVNYLLTPYSYKHLPKAIALCSRLGVDTLVATHLVHVCTEEQARLASYGSGTKYRWPLLVSRLAVLWRRTGLVLPGVKESPTPVCIKNPVENFFVGADGSVSPCVYLCPPVKGRILRRVGTEWRSMKRLVMGNLSEERLDAIWQKPDFVAFRNAFENRRKIYDRLLPPFQTDFEGMERLEQALRRIRDFFQEPAFQPPALCRGCPHLVGF